MEVNFEDHKHEKINIATIKENYFPYEEIKTWYASRDHTKSTDPVLECVLVLIKNNLFPEDETILYSWLCSCLEPYPTERVSGNTIYNEFQKYLKVVQRLNPERTFERPGRVKFYEKLTLYIDLLHEIEEFYTTQVVASMLHLGVDRNTTVNKWIYDKGYLVWRLVRLKRTNRGVLAENVRFRSGPQRPEEDDKET